MGNWVVDKPENLESNILTLGQRVANRFKVQPGYQTFARPLVWPSVQTMPLTAPQHNETIETEAAEISEEPPPREPTPGLLSKLRQSLSHNQSEPISVPTVPTTSPPNPNQITRKPDLSPAKGKPNKPGLRPSPTTPPSNSSIETIAPRRLPPTHQATKLSAKEPDIGAETAINEIESDETATDATELETSDDTDIDPANLQSVPLDVSIASTENTTNLEIQRDVGPSRDNTEKSDGDLAATKQPAIKRPTTPLPASPPTKTESVQRKDFASQPLAADAGATPESAKTTSSVTASAAENLSQPGEGIPDSGEESSPLLLAPPLLSDDVKQDGVGDEPSSTAANDTERLLPTSFEEPAQVQIPLEATPNEVTADDAPKKPTTELPADNSAGSAPVESITPFEEPNQEIDPDDPSLSQPNSEADLTNIVSEGSVQTSPLLEPPAIATPPKIQPRPNSEMRPYININTDSKPVELPVQSKFINDIVNDDPPSVEPTAIEIENTIPPDVTEASSDMQPVVKRTAGDLDDEATASSFRQVEATENQPDDEQVAFDNAPHPLEENNDSAGREDAVRPNSIPNTSTIQPQLDKPRPKPLVEPKQPALSVEVPFPTTEAVTETITQRNEPTQVDDRPRPIESDPDFPTVIEEQATSPAMAQIGDDSLPLSAPIDQFTNFRGQPPEVQLSPERSDAPIDDGQEANRQNVPLPQTQIAVNSSPPGQQKPLSEIDWVSKKPTGDNLQMDRDDSPMTPPPSAKVVDNSPIDMAQINQSSSGDSPVARTAHHNETSLQPVLNQLQSQRDDNDEAIEGQEVAGLNPESNTTPTVQSKQFNPQAQAETAIQPPQPPPEINLGHSVLPRESEVATAADVIQPFLNDRPEAIAAEAKAHIPAAVDELVGGDDTTTEAPAMDLDTMAREVYQILQRRLRVEMERYRG